MFKPYSIKSTRVVDFEHIEFAVPVAAFDFDSFGHTDREDCHEVK